MTGQVTPARLSRRTLLAGLGLAPVGVLTGCRALGKPVTSNGNQQGYVSGDGTYRYVPVDERSAAVELSGEGTDGATLDVADWRGALVVVNVWYASCAPCRIEAPDLAALANESADTHFLGVNTRDGKATAQTFEREFSIPYPSLLDAGTGAALLALRGTIPPQAVPSTIILDTDGRPAARIIGRAAPDVLAGLLDSVRTGRLAGSVGATASATGEDGA